MLRTLARNLGGPSRRINPVAFRYPQHQAPMLRAPLATIADEIRPNLDTLDAPVLAEHIQAPTHSSGTQYWRKIGVWQDVSEGDFLKYRWQVRLREIEYLNRKKTDQLNKVANTIDRKDKLLRFLSTVLPPVLPRSRNSNSLLTHLKTRDDFLSDVEEGMKLAPMSVRLTPHVLSVADWNNPLDDPIRRQFIPLRSTMKPDHPSLTMDSLHETEDSPVQGLVHRYPEKVLFLGKCRDSGRPIGVSMLTWLQRLRFAQSTAASAPVPTPSATTPNPSLKRP